MPTFLSPSNWIWKDNFDVQGQKTPVIMFFRKCITVTSDDIKHAGKIRISADSKYKLYVNGILAETGPAKGDRQVWYADEVDIASFLTEGENVIAVEVLRYPLKINAGNHSVFRSETPGLYVEEIVSDRVQTEDEAEHGRLGISADETWKVKQNTQTVIISEDPHFAPLQIYEKAAGDASFAGWKTAGYDESDWEAAKPYINIEVHRGIAPGNLLPRPIPYMDKKVCRFENLKTEIPAHSEKVITLDAGEEMTAFLQLAVFSGKGASIRLLQSECYVMDEKTGPAQVSVKADRTDSVHGHLEGYEDHYYVSGYGNQEKPEIYEPFWFRTFRFIEITVKTEEEPIVLEQLNYTDVHYPLQVKTEAVTSDPSLQSVWDMSIRTLTRCMHETYEDCPFYEQLQYAMDTRSQILYTYAVSADDRLARNAMEDFRRAQRSDGLLNCSYPNAAINVIPGFSVFYILMVFDHMMYFGDPALVKHHMPVIENILAYFESHCDEKGLTGHLGGENLEEPFWSFIDWADEWMPSTGVPPAYKNGNLTMESLYYLLGLQKAAELASYINREDSAFEYLKRAENLKKALRSYCMGKNGMLQDSAGVESYSQHCQVFGVLTGVLSEEEGRKNLMETIENKTDYPQCTIAMRYYLFRALERTGLYEYTDRYWEPWRTMVKNNASTCTESEAYGRSECHGWGALVLYELPSIVLGVRPAAPGYSKISVSPVCGYMTEAHGSVITPKGTVYVSWKKNSEGELDLSVKLPENMQSNT